MVRLDALQDGHAAHSGEGVIVLDRNGNTRLRDPMSELSPWPRGEFTQLGLQLLAEDRNVESDA